MFLLLRQSIASLTPPPGKGLFGLHFHIVRYTGSQDRNPNRNPNLEPGTNTEAREGCCLLIFSLWLAQLLSYSTKGHQPRDGTTHNQLGPALPITK